MKQLGGGYTLGLWGHSVPSCLFHFCNRSEKRAVVEIWAVMFPSLPWSNNEEPFFFFCKPCGACTCNITAKIHPSNLRRHIFYSARKSDSKRTQKEEWKLAFLAKRRWGRAQQDVPHSGYTSTQQPGLSKAKHWPAVTPHHLHVRGGDEPRCCSWRQ